MEDKKDLSNLLLMPMSEFVLWRRDFYNNKIREYPNTDHQAASRISHQCIYYAIFLNKGLTAEVFLPFDKGGNLLEAPIQPRYTIYGYEAEKVRYEKQLKEYQEAVDKVLLTDVDGKILEKDTVEYLVLSNWGDTIEGLLHKRGVPLRLTPAAIEQIGLHLD